MDDWIRDNLANLIGHALTLVAIIVGIKQIGRQHKSTLALQRDTAREELKKGIYQILVLKIRKLAQANLAASMYVYTVPQMLEIAERQRQSGGSFPPLTQRHLEFSRLHNEGHRALIDLMEEFEAWEIAFPGLQVFLTAMNAAAHDIRDAFNPLFESLLTVLPYDPPENSNVTAPTSIGQRPVSPAEIQKLQELVSIYYDAWLQVTCFAHDLTIEAQNNLLGGLFDRTLPQREPIDPAHVVISTEPTESEKLLDYFNTRTAWGKAKAIAEKDARANIAGR